MTYGVHLQLWLRQNTLIPSTIPSHLLNYTYWPTWRPDSTVWLYNTHIELMWHSKVHMSSIHRDRNNSIYKHALCVIPLVLPLSCYCIPASPSPIPQFLTQQNETETRSSDCSCCGDQELGIFSPPCSNVGRHGVVGGGKRLRNIRVGDRG